MLKENPENLIIFDKVRSEFFELNFQQFISFQRETSLKDDEYMVIKGTIVKPLGDSGKNLLANLDVYKRS